MPEPMMNVELISSMLLGGLFFAVVSYLWMALATSAVLAKAGVDTWPAWVPVYNGSALFRIAGLSPWLGLLLIIPGLSLVGWIVLALRLNPRFGWDVAWVVLAAVAPLVWLSILGWGSARWLGAPPASDALWAPDAGTSPAGTFRSSFAAATAPPAPSSGGRDDAFAPARSPLGATKHNLPAFAPAPPTTDATDDASSLAEPSDGEPDSDMWNPTPSAPKTSPSSSAMWAAPPSAGFAADTVVPDPWAAPSSPAAPYQPAAPVGWAATDSVLPEPPASERVAEDSRSAPEEAPTPASGGTPTDASPVTSVSAEYDGTPFLPPETIAAVVPEDSFGRASRRGATRIHDDSEFIAQARAAWAQAVPADPTPRESTPVLRDDEPVRPLIVPGPSGQMSVAAAPLPGSPVFQRPVAAEPVVPPVAPQESLVRRSPDPGPDESSLDLSGEVSAVVGSPIAGAPRAASSTVSAQQKGVDVPAPMDDDLDHTQIAVRRRPRWQLTLPEGDAPVDLTGTAVYLGRQPGAEGTHLSAQLIAVADSTRTVSKTHARLELVNGTWHITDLGSTNGVVLFSADGAETEIAARATAPLTERFLLGDAELRLTQIARS